MQPHRLNADKRTMVLLAGALILLSLSSNQVLSSVSQSQSNNPQGTVATASVPDYVAITFSGHEAAPFQRCSNNGTAFACKAPATLATFSFDGEETYYFSSSQGCPEISTFSCFDNGTIQGTETDFLNSSTNCQGTGTANFAGPLIVESGPMRSNLSANFTFATGKGTAETPQTYTYTCAQGNQAFHNVGYFEIADNFSLYDTLPVIDLNKSSGSVEGTTIDRYLFFTGGLANSSNTVSWQLGYLSATITANQNTGSAPLTVQFGGSATGGLLPYSYDWGFLQGSGGCGPSAYNSISQSPIVTYSCPGTYPVSLQVTDRTGTVVEVQDSITVVPPTSASSEVSTSPSQETQPTMEFVEHGLEEGTKWSVTLVEGGSLVTSSSVSDSISFPITTGVYQFSVPALNNTQLNFARTTIHQSNATAELIGNGTLSYEEYKPFPSYESVVVTSEDVTEHVLFVRISQECHLALLLRNATLPQMRTTSSGSATTCDRVVPLYVGGNVSLSQITSPAMGYDIQSHHYVVSFNMTGKSGTRGNVSLSIPRVDVPNGLAPEVFVNGAQAQIQSSAQDGSYYYVTFVTHFSVDRVDILFAQQSELNVINTTSSSSQSTMQSPTKSDLLYLGVAIAVVITISLAAVFSRRRQTSRGFPSP